MDIMRYEYSENRYVSHLVSSPMLVSSGLERVEF